MVSSLERLLGKSFGRAASIYTSNGEEIKRLTAQTQKLLEIWAKWWAWEPADKSGAWTSKRPGGEPASKGHVRKWDFSAVMGYRKKLESGNEEERTDAACKLAEYGDASGLAELKKRLGSYGGGKDRRSYGECEEVSQLISALERVTGKSFGELPPHGVINMEIAEKAARGYEWLVKAWLEWWEWKPQASEAASGTAR